MARFYFMPICLLLHRMSTQLVHNPTWPMRNSPHTHAAFVQPGIPLTIKLVMYKTMPDYASCMERPAQKGSSHLSYLHVTTYPPNSCNNF